jgi:aminoglycoside phosphotransferase (APT) family kinase protein
LVDPGDLTVTGVIDWTDAAIADPAAEAGRLLRDLGPDALDLVLDGMDGAGGDRDVVATRAWCHARLLAVEDLAYAIAHRPRLVPHERATLLTLFDVDG